MPKANKTKHSVTVDKLGLSAALCSLLTENYSYNVYLYFISLNNR